MQDERKDMIGAAASLFGGAFGSISTIYLASGDVSSSVNLGALSLAFLAASVPSKYFDVEMISVGMLTGVLVGTASIKDFPQVPQVSAEVQRLEQKIDALEYKDLLPPSVAAVQFYPSDFAKD